MFGKLFGFNKTAGPILSGETLLADFTAAVTNMTTAETAKTMAEQSEQEALETINYVGSQSQNPSASLQGISPEMQKAIVRSSLDAHVQKAQAEQIDNFASSELERMEQEAKKNYIGKRVRITITDPNFEPVETYWWNSNTGDYDKGRVKFNSVKGTIEDLSLHKNVIIIKPSFGSRIILPQRKFLAIYVINPSTLLPAVGLTLA